MVILSTLLEFTAGGVFFFFFGSRILAYIADRPRQGKKQATPPNTFPATSNSGAKCLNLLWSTDGECKTTKPRQSERDVMKPRYVSVRGKRNVTADHPPEVNTDYDCKGRREKKQEIGRALSRRAGQITYVQQTFGFACLFASRLYVLYILVIELSFFTLCCSRPCYSSISFEFRQDLFPLYAVTNFRGRPPLFEAFKRCSDRQESRASSCQSRSFLARLCKMSLGRRFTGRAQPKIWNSGTKLHIVIARGFVLAWVPCDMSHTTPSPRLTSRMPVEV